MKWSALIPMGLIYLVAIVVFACIYTFALPQGFYHSYVKYEPEMREMRTSLQKSLGETIRTGLSTNPDLGNGVQFQLGYGLLIGGEQDGVLTGSIEMMGSLERGDERQMYTTRLPILLSGSGLHTVEKPGSPRTIVKDNNELKDRTQTIYITRDTQKPAQDETIFAHESTDQTLVTDVLGKAPERIELSDPQTNGLYTILNAERGFPESTFGRMLYFSAITITTVGYGDIAPLTPLGRFFAALEATVGIILLGVLVSQLTK